MEKTKLPGFGLSLHDIPRDNKIFRSALHLGGNLEVMPLTTLREFAMLEFINKITDKPNWHEKIFDETIKQKWTQEILDAPGVDFSPAMVETCFEELHYKVGIFKETQAVTVFNGDVVKSDHAIPANLAEFFKREALKLEDVPEHEKDWHPKSDDKVLDLVHPSLFPLMYGTTRVLAEGVTSLDDCIVRCGEGVTTETHRYSGQEYSVNFQWLPCNVSLADSEPRIVSYINNLHPQRYPDIYTAVERIIDKTIPLWNMTLTTLAADRYPKRVEEFTDVQYQPEEEPSENGNQRGDTTHTEDVEGDDTSAEEQNSGSDDNSDWEDEDDDEEGFGGNRRRVIQPEAVAFEEVGFSGDEIVDLKREFQKDGIQVIVKLANIYLTPEKPSYEGGSWHVEGQLNEHICASAIYYYDNENVTPSSLAFRQRSDTDNAEEIGYDQDEHSWLKQVFGCKNGSHSMQQVGKVDTKQGRLITFPNVLQHQVQPFKLEDSTKPGHRKILALFLVDPRIRIISTANVPCQRRDWWEDVVQEAASRPDNRWESLPAELQHKVYSHVEDFPVSMEKAKEVRLALMKERMNYVHDQKRAFMGDGFSLCEH